MGATPKGKADPPTLISTVSVRLRRREPLVKSSRVFRAPVEVLYQATTRFGAP